MSPPDFQRDHFELLGLPARFSVDPGRLEQGYRDLVQISDPKPYVSLEGIRNIQRLIKIQNPVIGNVKVEDLIDNRPLKRLEESGFLQRTYSAYGVNK